MAQLFTLSDDRAVTGFHVEQIPLPYVAQLVPPLLASIDPERFIESTNIIKERLLNLSRQPPADARAAARAVTGDDEDDYDPAAAFQEGEAEQVLNRLDQMPSEGLAGPGIAIGPFQLPSPPPMNEEEKEEYTKTAFLRVFDTLRDLDLEAKQRPAKKLEAAKSFTRLAPASHDRDGWITLMTRIATRSPFGLTVSEGTVKEENDDRNLIKGKDYDRSLAIRIREALLNYIMEDFRRRINVAIAWLNEEWYCDRLSHQQRQQDNANDTDLEHQTPTYTLYTLRLLDSLIPYLDTKDNKILIRFVSEIPALPPALFPRLAKIADDPERVNLVVQGLLYLVMFRPPVRELALDALEGLWRSNEDARKPAEKHLARWRPEVVKAGIEDGKKVKEES
jgi:symplekin